MNGRSSFEPEPEPARLLAVGFNKNHIREWLQLLSYGIKLDLTA
ncbi:hypothetical protein [Neobacillus cucumis]|nr:hypothetical protein [Neobacillus cucumis]MBM7653515.1 hypothetical protein [Neobacillus cucumis]MDR4947219.1 hypothetical protein [Neobacillus cucumis]